MAYNNAIPTASQKLNQSQPQLLANFAAIQTLIEVDHGTFGAATEGMHEKVTLPVQSPAPSFAAGDNGIYSKLYATTNKNETYIHGQTFAGTQDVPATASILGQATPTYVSTGTDGFSYLPSGILLHWDTISGTGLTTITVDATFPAFSVILSVIVCPYSSSTSDADFAVRLVDIVSATQYRVFFSARSTSASAAGGAKVLIIGF